MPRLDLCLGLLLSGCAVHAQDQPNVKAPGDKPKENITALVGNYYHGDGLGTNCRLSVAADGRFSYIWRGCLGVYGQNKGTASLINEHLILKPEQPNKKGDFGTATDFIPVRWGKRRYLIAREEMKSFCSSVNLGDEPRDNIHGLFYLGHGHEHHKVTGTPEVPGEWEAFFLKEPIHAKVVKVLADGTAQIDCGSKRGLRDGMELRTQKRDQVEVVKVEPETAIVREMYGDASFQIGQQIHSRLSANE